MKLSISNIAWDEQQDDQVYAMIHEKGFTGIEIAPTRIIKIDPYKKVTDARMWAQTLKKRYGFCVPSIQSIWYGRTENIFGTEEEHNFLIDYTKKAVDFAHAIGCGNLVFGCPRNRNKPMGADEQIGRSFFKIVGDYAKEKGTVIGVEANPTIYNTNYINDTMSAINLIKEIKSDGIRLNLDLGTVIQNGEDIEDLIGKVNLINHIHISEPGLKNILVREVHKDLAKILKKENYGGYISIEMGKVDDLAHIYNATQYVAEVFG